MLYLNCFCYPYLLTFPNLTLTSVVFEFLYHLSKFIHGYYLTLTSVVFEYNSPRSFALWQQNLTLTSVVFEWSVKLSISSGSGI